MGDFENFTMNQASCISKRIRNNTADNFAIKHLHSIRKEGIKEKRDTYLFESKLPGRNKK